MKGREYQNKQAAPCSDCGKDASVNVEHRCERCEIARRNAMQHVERLDQGKKHEKP